MTWWKAVGESAEVCLEGIVDSRQELLILRQDVFFSRRERVNECSTGFAVLSKKECLRQN